MSSFNPGCVYYHKDQRQDVVSITAYIVTNVIEAELYGNEPREVRFALPNAGAPLKLVTGDIRKYPWSQTYNCQFAPEVNVKEKIESLNSTQRSLYEDIKKEIDRWIAERAYVFKGKPTLSVESPLVKSFLSNREAVVESFAYRQALLLCSAAMA
jgi:hypothetical protein